MPTVTTVDPGRPLGRQTPVVGVVPRRGGVSAAAGAEAVDQALGGRLDEALRAAGATGKADDVVKVPTLGLAPFPVVVATGLGDAEPGPEQVRRAAGAALRRMNSTAEVRLCLPPQLAVAAAEGALLGSYAFTSYKAAAAAPALRRLLVPGEAVLRSGLRRAVVIADAVRTVRDLVNTPPNDLYPATFAARVADLAGGAGIEAEILEERELRRGRYGALLAVGAGSVHAPRLVRLTYRARRARTRVALVGKGVTFDSGGLNLKTQHMAWWKSDMAGGAAVAATVLAAAALAVPVEVTATIPLAENLPSGSSYRPSDVVTTRDGRTVEVGDTDSEGRLILADALTRAAEDRPDTLVEVSTLTGAALVALGTRVFGVMGDPELRDRIVGVADAAGEGAWAMPLPDDLRAQLDSPVADLVNVAPERWAAMLVGGVFLREFMPAGVPWAHLDIVGPAWNSGAAWGYTPRGGTGASVRTLIALLEDLAS